MPVFSLSDKVLKLLEDKGWRLYVGAESFTDVPTAITQILNDTPYLVFPAVDSDDFSKVYTRILEDTADEIFPDVQSSLDPTEILRIREVCFRNIGLELFYEGIHEHSDAYIDQNSLLSFLRTRLQNNFLLSPGLSSEIYNAFFSVNLKLSVERNDISWTIEDNEQLKAGRLYTPHPIINCFSDEEYGLKLQDIIEKQNDVFRIGMGRKDIKFHHLSFTLEGMQLYAEQSKGIEVIPYDNILPQLQSLKYGTRSATDPGIHKGIFPLIPSKNACSLDAPA